MVQKMYKNVHCSNQLNQIYQIQIKNILSKISFILLPIFIQNLIFNFKHLYQFKTSYRTSVPSKATYRKISPALWKIGSTDFVKVSKKMPFLDTLANFQHKLMKVNSTKFVKLGRIGPSLKTLVGTPYSINLSLIALLCTIES